MANLPTLSAKFKGLGFTFTKANRTKIKDESKGTSKNRLFSEVPLRLRAKARQNTHF
ncbi:MAG: hypothetical protein LBD37_04470 [Treponema sp.]|nr:hypothetical protein [Treponema sp.]